MNTLLSSSLLSALLCIGFAADAYSATDTFVALEPAEFTRGSAGSNWDERPAHQVRLTSRYEVSKRPVTNAEFEQFRPEHRQQRAKEFGGDNDSAVNLSWQDAMAYCEWLSARTGQDFRLPTEAEWEHAARTVPELFPAEKACEEWCYDWYGPYPEGSIVDPLGHAEGEARVMRGGPYRATKERVSATTRTASLPDDRHRLSGFRIVRGKLPEGKLLTDHTQRRWQRDVSQATSDWQPPADSDQPFFAEPREYVKIPETLRDGPLYVEHNHDPALAYCPNGDLLAIWYSTQTESGRELAVAASRLRQGTQEWEEADVFWNIAGRNDHAPAMFTAPDGTLFHFNGLGVDKGWGELVVVLRTSNDNGATWSAPRIIASPHGPRHQPIASAFGASDGTIYLPCDADPGPKGGTVLHASRDHGATWKDLSLGEPQPKFAAGESGAWIAGIHAGVDEIEPGILVAAGRGDNIDNHMPWSISRDRGQTWTYSASPFPPISSGQRPVLRKLREGPLMLISFTPGSTFTDVEGKEYQGQGIFAALSYDGGQTWPVRKLLTDGKRREMNGLAWTGPFVMDASHAEPKGYLTAVQSPDGMIHLISSGLYYQFNLKWLETPAKAQH